MSHAQPRYEAMTGATSETAVAVAIGESVATAAVASLTSKWTPELVEGRSVPKRKRGMCQCFQHVQVASAASARCRS